MSRPDWPSVWAAVARAIAQRSLCSRAQVGAVIVTADNRIVATGYNGPPAGFQHGGQNCTAWCERAQPSIVRAKEAEVDRSPRIIGERGPEMIRILSPDYSDCPSLHAEANALMAADRSAWQGGTIYVTGDVCYSCAKLLSNSGLAQVVIIVDETDRSYRNPAKSIELMQSCGLSVVRARMAFDDDGEP